MSFLIGGKQGKANEENMGCRDQELFQMSNAHPGEDDHTSPTHLISLSGQMNCSGHGFKLESELGADN